MKKLLRKRATKSLTLRARMPDGKELTKKVALPTSLATAVKLYGEQEVFQHFIRNFIINIQAQMRSEARPARPRANILSVLMDSTLHEALRRPRPRKAPRRRK